MPFCIVECRQEICSGSVPATLEPTALGIRRRRTNDGARRAHFLNLDSVFLRNQKVCCEPNGGL
jgi:hypothetical protein